MTIDHASQLYDAMDHVRRQRVMRDFDRMFKDPRIDIRDALIRAVDAEATEIEKQMLLEQNVGGCA